MQLCTVTSKPLLFHSLHPFWEQHKNAKKKNRCTRNLQAAFSNNRTRFQLFFYIYMKRITRRQRARNTKQFACSSRRLQSTWRAIFYPNALHCLMGIVQSASDWFVNWMDRMVLVELRQHGRDHVPWYREGNDDAGWTFANSIAHSHATHKHSEG